MIVDYKHKPAVFPPFIVSTNERPVLLLELTCPAEEGIEAARVRKLDRYQNLLYEISRTKCWTAELYTLEIGARGLVACRTFKIFRWVLLQQKRISFAGLCPLFLLVAPSQSTVPIKKMPGFPEG